jgi:hypothetical protein
MTKCWGISKDGENCQYLGHMTFIFYSVKCWMKLTHRVIQ